VRKNGSGYYLVLHPHHPAAGRPDFVPWVLGKQSAEVANKPALPAPSKLDMQPEDLELVAARAPVLPARHPLNAMSLRQMSRDLGTGALGSKGPDAMLTALASLGLPTPVVARARGNQNVARADSSSSGTVSGSGEEDGKEVRPGTEHTCTSRYAAATSSVVGWRAQGAVRLPPKCFNMPTFSHIMAAGALHDAVHRSTTPRSRWLTQHVTHVSRSAATSVGSRKGGLRKLRPRQRM
jgi:hypothetical protein